MASDRANDKKNKVICTFCKDEHIHNPVYVGQGNNVGHSQILARTLMKSYGNKPPKQHPLSMYKYRKKGSSAQAHHLICSEVMDDEEWAEISSNFGYNIDCKENGVFLPADMHIACELKIPLHRGNHSATETTEKVSYVKAVDKKIKKIKTDALNGVICEEKRDIIAELNAKSKAIWVYVECFDWTLTFDGKHYKGGKKGCLGKKSLSKKRDVLSKVKECPLGRNHNVNVKLNSYYLERK